MIVDVTPLVVTKPNWPDGWKAVINEDNGVYMSVWITRPGDLVAYAMVHVFHGSGMCEIYRPTSATERDAGVRDFDCAIATLSEV